MAEQEVPSVEGQVRAYLDRGKAQTRLGRGYLADRDRGISADLSLADGLEPEDLFQFLTSSIVALEQVCINLGAEIDRLGGHVAALEEDE